MHFRSLSLQKYKDQLSEFLVSTNTQCIALRIYFLSKKACVEAAILSPPLLQSGSAVGGRALEVLCKVLPSVVAPPPSPAPSLVAGCSAGRQAMLELHSHAKEIEYTDNLMVCDDVIIMSSIRVCMMSL